MGTIINPYAYSAAGSSLLNPGSYLSNLDWDMDGDQATISGTPEFDWPDLSSAAKHYGQNTVARQPTLVSGPNGHQLVRFGTNKCLVPDPTARDFGTANTLICVCTPSSAADYILKGSGAEGRPAFISGFNPGSGVKAFEYWNSSSGTQERATFAASASGLHILTLARTDDTGNYIGYFDGTEVFNTAVNTTRDWATNNVAIIGAFTAGASAYDGDVGYIIHFNANHAGTGGLTNLHNALKSRFSIA